MKLTLEEKYNKVRNALIGIIGVSDRKKLEQIEVFVRSADAPNRDKTVSLNAIHALLDTMEE